MSSYLHKQDDWELISYSRTRTSNASWVWHKCPGRDGIGGLRWRICHCREGMCSKCGARIPDEILGLWKMHNWDHI